MKNLILFFSVLMFFSLSSCEDQQKTFSEKEVKVITDSMSSLQKYITDCCPTTKVIRIRNCSQSDITINIRYLNRPKLTSYNEIFTIRKESIIDLPFNVNPSNIVYPDFIIRDNFIITSNSYNTEFNNQRTSDGVTLRNIIVRDNSVTSEIPEYPCGTAVNPTYDCHEKAPTVAYTLEMR